MLPQTPEDVSTILAAAKNFVDGFTSGLSPTSGAWFDTEPGDSPYSYAPKSERRSTASGLLGRPTDWWFSGATADSRGAPRNVTDDDWSLIGGGGPGSGGSTAKIPYLGLGVRVGFL